MHFPAPRNESQRPSAVEALNHPWLLGVDEDGQDGGIVLVGSVGSVGSMGSVGSFESLDATSLVGAPNPAKLFGPSSQPLGDTLVQRLQRYGGYSKLKKVRGAGVESIRPVLVTPSLPDRPPPYTPLPFLLPPPFNRWRCASWR